MINKKQVTAIILAAGNSTRYGKNKNKNFEIVDGKTVLSYSVYEFDKNKYIDNIIIAIKESEVQEVKRILEKLETNKDINIVIGGDTRAQSVYNCITKTKSEIVIIHDGARPLIKQKYINECIESMDMFKGVTIGVKSKDTVKITNENNTVINTTNRDNTWLIQTPQCFDRNTLLCAYNKYKNMQLTDECALLEKENYKIKVIEGNYTNIKITTSEDLEFAKKFLS